MIKVEAIFKSKNGNTFTRRANGSCSAKKVAESLAAEHKGFELVSYKVVSKY